MLLDDEIVNPEMGNEEEIIDDNIETIVVDPVEALMKQVQTLKNEVLMGKADIENIRKRSEKERTEASQFGAFRFAKDLLKIVDGIDMTMTSLEKDSDPASIIQGLKLVHQEFERLLNNHGIKKVDSLHHAFNPDFHEVVAEVEDDSDHPSQTVIQVMQEGYKMQERLLRAAMVSVKK